MADAEPLFAPLVFPGPRRAELQDHRALADGLCTEPVAARRLEDQELRQLVHLALGDLTPDELRVIELRYQHKSSPGQAAARLGMARRRLQALETQALDKIRARLLPWHTGK
jgi:RNA polymerase sigma factor (sigma-70 family)